MGDGGFLEVFFILLLGAAPLQPGAAGQKGVAQDSEHPGAEIRSLPE